MKSQLKIKRTITALIAASLSLLAIVMLPATGSTKSTSGIRSYHGKVTSVSQENSAFRVRLNSGSGKRFRVNDSTTFEGIGGFAGLEKGLRVEVKAKKGSSLARKVEPATGTGGADDRGDAHHGNGADDPVGDDHGSGGNGADDPAGDDHGSGGHGADDPAGDDNGSGGHGADDPAGDDHGSGGNGADDAPGDDHGGHHGGNEAGDDHGSGGHGSDD